MADVTVTLANRYDGRNPGETIHVDEQTARQLRRGGIAVPDEAKPTRKAAPAKAKPRPSAPRSHKPATSPEPKSDETKADASS